MLWSGIDERIGVATTALDDLGREATGERVRLILHGIVQDFAPDPLALALRNAAAMALEEELVRETGVRLARLSAAVSRAACAAGIDVMRADVLGAAQAAAVMSALRVWAEEGAGRGTPESVLHEALARVHDLPWRD